MSFLMIVVCRHNVGIHVRAVLGAVIVVAKTNNPTGPSFPARATPGLHAKSMKKNTGDKNLKKAAKNAKEAIALTHSNQTGPRVGKREKRQSKALRRRPLDSAIRRKGPPGYTPAILPGDRGFHPAVLAWARGLENPFTGVPAKCPFNFNPVPSYLSMAVTTVASRIGQDSVAAGTTRQLTIFPGHGSLGQTAAANFAATVEAVVPDMDEVAYHYQFQSSTGGVVTCFGPCNFIDCVGTTRNATAYMDTLGLALGTATSTANVGTTPIGWNATIPFTGDVRAEGHLRVKCLSMGIKIVNTTPELSRGGSMVSFQPATACSIQSPQAANSIHPSFKDWGPDGCTITWIPRLRDLAYWHPTEGGALTAGVVTAPIINSSLEAPGIVIFLNNPTAAAQSYDVELVAHWEISGFSVQTLSAPGKATTVNESVLKGALSAQTASAPTAQGFSSTLHAAAGFAMKAAGAVGSPRVAAAAAAGAALL